MTITLPTTDAVRAFADAVRRELADLEPEVVEELTDGLEADLADKLEDGAELGDPSDYARELREAAGVAPAPRPSIADNVRENLAELRARLEPLMERPAVARVVAFLVSLRPVWWVLRAWLIFALFTSSNALGVPENGWHWLALLALTIVSVQWGRGRWLPGKWGRALVVAVSVLAVISAPVALSVLDYRLNSGWADTAEPAVPDGLLLDGTQITNVFAYGPDGELLEQVRLYDQDGNPLDVLPESWGGETIWVDEDTLLVPSDEVDGNGWNVFPLQSVRSSAVDEWGRPRADASRSDREPPFRKIQQLLGYEPPAADAPDASEAPAP